ncbi:hypothetical protein F4821DRAFT_263920 [Hypoxylon rubiginosum]|uniref:Uncharacterized protein n=1 Tax=Hypoxylon rubiginosum TaxID=110542 RepID=A0ACC0CPS2_9PEZI|nr:hypothetical protein F4821DRAFT_263920 [Hypoxylon rubiginosum]
MSSSPVRPITCRVVDFDEVGLQDMYVSLECWRPSEAISKKFESFTNPQGIIEKWFRCAELPLDFEPVDASDYTRICLTFSTAMYFSSLRTPWVTVQAHLDSASLERHSVKLQFGPGNSTYSLRPVPLPLLHSPETVEMPSMTLVSDEEGGHCSRGAPTTGPEESALIFWQPPDESILQDLPLSPGLPSESKPLAPTSTCAFFTAAT